MPAVCSFPGAGGPVGRQDVGRWVVLQAAEESPLAGRWGRLLGKSGPAAQQWGWAQPWHLRLVGGAQVGMPSRQCTMAMKE